MGVGTLGRFRSGDERATVDHSGNEFEELPTDPLETEIEIACSQTMTRLHAASSISDVAAALAYLMDQLMSLICGKTKKTRLRYFVLYDRLIACLMQSTKQKYSEILRSGSDIGESPQKRYCCALKKYLHNSLRSAKSASIKIGALRWLMSARRGIR